LITIKKSEEQLKNTPVWDKLCKVPKEQIEEVLVDIDLEGKTVDEMVDGLNSIFAWGLEESEGPEDESEKKMMDMWILVESGKMKQEEAEKELSVEKKKKEEDELA